jgi:hypothetical protein
MEKVTVTRRQIIKSLIALGAGSAFLFYWETLPHDVSGSITVIGGDGKPTLGVFSLLSSVVTLRDDLNPEMMKEMYAAFLDEPWGPDHMLRCYRKIMAALPKKEIATERPPLADTSWQFDKGEAWFLRHLLTTWYTGIYYHEERQIRAISYEHALMFDAARDTIPVPFVDATGFGTWAEPPENIK